jgi:hypothetical protein
VKWALQKLPSSKAAHFFKEFRMHRRGVVGAVRPRRFRHQREAAAMSDARADLRRPPPPMQHVLARRIVERGGAILTHACHARGCANGSPRVYAVNVIVRIHRAVPEPGRERGAAQVRWRCRHRRGTLAPLTGSGPAAIVPSRWGGSRRRRPTRARPAQRGRGGAKPVVARREGLKRSGDRKSDGQAEPAGNIPFAPRAGRGYGAEMPHWAEAPTPPQD